jgi:hypothetical protein
MDFQKKNKNKQNWNLKHANMITLKKKTWYLSTKKATKHKEELN